MSIVRASSRLAALCVRSRNAAASSAVSPPPEKPPLCGTGVATGGAFSAYRRSATNAQGDTRSHKTAVCRRPPSVACRVFPACYFTVRSHRVYYTYYYHNDTFPRRPRARIRIRGLTHTHTLLAMCGPVPSTVLSSSTTWPPRGPSSLPLTSSLPLPPE